VQLFLGSTQSCPASSGSNQKIAMIARVGATVGSRIFAAAEDRSPETSFVKLLITKAKTSDQGKHQDEKELAGRQPSFAFTASKRVR
jgi:hypothetical protein